MGRVNVADGEISKRRLARAAASGVQYLSHRGGDDAARSSGPLRSRRGFTLLEMLIVSILVSVLMMGVWSLFRTWGRLYERGERRVRHAQLVRSLCDQFTDDARSVAYVLPAPSEGKRPGSDSGTNDTSGGNRALMGGGDWLVLEVLQPPNPFLLSGRDDNSEEADPEDGPLDAPELQRVMYTFEPPQSDSSGSLSSAVEEMAEEDDTELVGEEAEAEPFGGLLRMLVPVEKYERLVGGNSSSRSSPGLRDAAWKLRDLAVKKSENEDAVSPLAVSGRSAADERTTLSAGVVSQDEVPEVVWLEFRYFDGSTWTSGWDSRAQGQLPVAIEMRFELSRQEEQTRVGSQSETELVENDQSESGSFAEKSASESDSSSSTDMGLGEGGGGYEEAPYHRCVVYLQPQS